MDNYIDISKNFSSDIDEFNGNIEGYFVSIEQENVKNFLEGNTRHFSTLYDLLRKKVDNCLVIKNINIEDEYRGEGLGQDLIINEINERYPDAVILVCSHSEEQREGFELEEFYRSLDFDVVVDTASGPIMVYPSSLAEELSLDLKKSLKAKKKFNKIR